MHSRECEGIRQSPGRGIMQIAGWNPSPSARPNVREFIRAPRRAARPCTIHAVCANGGCYMHIAIRSFVRTSVRTYVCPSVRLRRPSAVHALMHAYATLIAEHRAAHACTFRVRTLLHRPAASGTRDLINERINRRY